MFNHESARRGETFVTRKITRGLAAIATGLESCLHIGNLDAKRDWGHAKDYVEMQWRMLQQDAPKDFVIATGIQLSVRDFIQSAAAQLGVVLRWQGSGQEEQGVVERIEPSSLIVDTPIKQGDTLVKVDPSYYRPAEVETLLGDPTKAHESLGWKPTITLDEMVEEMLVHDLDLAGRQVLLKDSGFSVSSPRE